MLEDFTIQLTPQMMALVPVVALFLQVLKKIEAIQTVKAWFPFVSIAIAFGLCYSLGEVENAVLSSIVIGLVASGSYDLLKGKGK